MKNLERTVRLSGPALYHSRLEIRSDQGDSNALQPRLFPPRDKQALMSIADRLRIREVRLLSDNWYVLKTTTFDWRRSDGAWQTSSRETYDRGNGAALIPYNRRLGTVLLTRQFRYPAYVNGYDGLMIEAPAGLLDEADPEARIRAEVQEEIGYWLGE